MSDYEAKWNREQVRQGEFERHQEEFEKYAEYVEPDPREKQRSPTGIYVRVKTEAGYIPLGIDQLTDEELDDYIKRRGEDFDWSGWVRTLAKWIRDNVKS